MAFKLAQTFYLDKTSVRDAEHVTLTSIDVYFKQKPLETANRSGITAPGVSLFLMETRDNDIPNISRVLENGNSRLGFYEIVASSDASIPSKFAFPKALLLETNKSYAIVIAYDGDEDYEMWTCREGERIVGTNITTSGSTARNVGNYYEYSSTVNSSTNPGASLSEQWKPLTNVDLKFTVNIGVYAANTTIDNINTTYLLPSDPTEYLMYDRYNYKTRDRNAVIVGEMVFQETPVAYGPIYVNSNSTVITCNSAINFTTLLNPSSSTVPAEANGNPTISQKSYIVLRNGSGASANVNVREVISISSNTQIIVDRVPDFSSNTATFSVTPVGKISYHGYTWYNGRWWDGSTNTMDVYSGRKTDLLRLVEPNSNSTVRFVNNMVESIIINSGGTGYSNSDYITIYPTINANTSDPNHVNYISSYSNAVANVVTNGSGTITGIAVKNAGYGLISNVNMTITTSAGTSANLTVEVGSTLRSERANAMFGNCVVTNVPIHRTYPHCHFLTNQHHTYRMFQHFPYYVMPGTEHILRVSSPAAKREVESFNNSDSFDVQSNDGRVFVLSSRSNEVLMSNATVVVANGVSINTAVQASSLVEISINSNNAFSIPLVVTDDVYNYKYIINNTTDGESKGQGRALARHVSNKVTFAENRRAEDVIIYLDAYRPIGTDLTVYARIHNKADPEAFDDKDWTKLELKSNNSLTYSSLTNDKNTIEYTYGLPSSPASVNTLSGSITTTLNSANVTGSGTAFGTDLAINDVVKIYSPLFPQNYIVSVITAIANSTHLTLADTVGNNSYVGTGFKMDFIGRTVDEEDGTEKGSPLQAWSNESTDNVARYYNSSMVKFDTYNTFQVKIVMTSNNTSIVPKVENIRAVGVSA